VNAKEPGDCRGLNGFITTIMGLFMVLITLLVHIGNSRYPDEVYDVLLRHGYIWTDNIYMILVFVFVLVMGIGFLWMYWDTRNV